MQVDQFMQAVKSGNAGAVRDGLTEDRSLATAHDEEGVSALMQALYRRSGDIVNLLRQAHPELDVFETAAVGDAARLRRLLAGDQALVNAWSADGFTPLHFACFFGHEEAVRLLLEAGADVQAVARNPMQVMPLHSAAAARSLPIVRALLDYDAPPNARQQQGWTALHAAAQNGDSEMYALLVSRGADPQAKNDAGTTPEQLAKAGGT